MAAERAPWPGSKEPFPPSSEGQVISCFIYFLAYAYMCGHMTHVYAEAGTFSDVGPLVAQTGLELAIFLPQPPECSSLCHHAHSAKLRTSLLVSCSVKQKCPGNGTVTSVLHIRRPKRSGGRGFCPTVSLCLPS